eukprot:CAMPEP_0181183274 /NCGR_PEP_ID=MMETSP1096-20121128/8340_1 /TAXON_ID=156174 ORGANISM="Chrysochromulina ericina, Strain CCMP281" /NCGR_SAMPLE_ID=MMETSP1096 /ASSEMBLY_ACC=CAM_ASM_000453 /LENGTH=60 /DNA_ID=CAMNT_0023271947 /DNA_START=469 /DNA_END=651 /DNA_ORIENTATION=+
MHAPAQTSIVQLRSVELLQALEVDVPEPPSPQRAFLIAKDALPRACTSVDHGYDVNGPRA